MRIGFLGNRLIPIYKAIASAMTRIGNCISSIGLA
jgi:hypothetical protein